MMASGWRTSSQRPITKSSGLDVVHVTGCGICHASLYDVSGIHCQPNPCPGGETCVQHSYHIQAIGLGQDTGDEDNYSEALELHTSSTWGDTVSTCAGNVCKPPDGLVGLDDIMAAISRFQGVSLAPVTWLDIDPSNDASTPDQIIGLGNIMGCIAGFQGAAYPGNGPLGCP